MHKVERKETIFSISQMYGISQEELIAANPELKTQKLKKGSFLFIPYPKQEAKKGETDKPSPAYTPSNEELFSQSLPKLKQIQTIKAAVMLPFMAGTKTNADEQTRMVEYYEGLLIAVDSLKRQGISVDLYAYDTKGSANAIQSILNRNEMKDMDIIFGPAHTGNLKPLTDFADKNNIRLVVPFLPKVDQVFNNPHVYQINTPQSYLYSEVYEHFLRKFSQSNIIFLDAGTNDKEKAEFIKGMKDELNNSKVKFKQVRLGTEMEPNKIIAAWIPCAKISLSLYPDKIWHSTA